MAARCATWWCVSLVGETRLRDEDAHLSPSVGPSDGTRVQVEADALRKPRDFSIKKSRDQRCGKGKRLDQLPQRYMAVHEAHLGRFTGSLSNCYPG